MKDIEDKYLIVLWVIHIDAKQKGYHFRRIIQKMKREVFLFKWYWKYMDVIIFDFWESITICSFFYSASNVNLDINSKSFLVIMNFILNVISLFPWFVHFPQNIIPTFNVHFMTFILYFSFLSSFYDFEHIFVQFHFWRCIYIKCYNHTFKMKTR